MLKTIILTALTLLIAIGGGAASVWYALNRIDGLGAMTVGEWVAFPAAGTPYADPYSKARIAREAALPLGAAEGLSFIAREDAGGGKLARNCTYRIEGRVPPARFWTIYAANESLDPIPRVAGRTSGLHSRQILRLSDDSFVLNIGPNPSPGNWLPVDGSGSMALLMTLYDTPVASNSRVEQFELPQVLRIACDE
jgi:hypothetical protein